MIVRTSAGEYECDHLLGADGPNSMVRKKLAAPFTRAQLSVAAGFFVHGVSARRDDRRSRRMLEQPGYLWSFPRRDHLAVGVCAPAALRVTSSALRAQSRTWIEQHHRHSATTLTPYAWPIPSVGFEDPLHMTSSGPGWMLLGDAAGTRGSADARGDLLRVAVGPVGGRRAHRNLGFSGGRSLRREASY